MSLVARTIALAGVAQAGRLALDVARTGRCDAQAMRVSLDSVLAIDAVDAAAVYGGVSGLQYGLGTLKGLLSGQYSDPALLRMMATLLHVGRRLHKAPETLAVIARGIDAARHLRQDFDEEPELLGERLGELYAATISGLKPKVMVQGHDPYIRQTELVTRVRALLLAAVRGAVLWRQSGGNYFNLALQRGAMARQAQTISVS